MPDDLASSQVQPLASTPVVNSVSPTSGSSAGGTTVTITGAHFTGATAVRFGSTDALSFTVDSTTQITAVTPPGSGSVQVTVTTPSGTSQQFIFYTYVAAPAPTLSSLSPPSGSPAGGTVVTLTGSALSGATEVKFGGANAASFTVDSDSQITAVSPAGSGTVQVTVVTPGGTSNGLPFSYVAAPTLAGVVPDAGPVTGGNSVTLTGTDLTGATSVTFGGTPALSFTVDSPTQITAVVPPGSPGPAAVAVTTPGGTTPPGVFYFYTEAPVLADVSPDAGPTAGGSTVVITGIGFVGATSVTFGGVPASSFTVDSDTQITATTPPGTGAVNIQVTGPGGTGGGLFYSYVPVPVLSGITPSAGPAYGGTQVTLTGTDLTLTESVLFGADPAGFVALSDTSVVAVAPSGSTGPVPVTVVTPGGTSAAVTYTRVAAPVI